MGIPLMKLCPHYTGGYHVLNTMVLPFVPKKMRENEIKTTKQLLIIIIYFIIENFILRDTHLLFYIIPGNI